MEEKPLIYDLELDELVTILASWKESEFRVKQIWEGIYKHLWTFPEDGITTANLSWSNLSKSLRTRLNSHFSFQHLEPAAVLRSKDKETNKTLFYLPDENAIEVVLMRYRQRQSNGRRYSICISSQAGCALGCKFCATGQMGYFRNLTAGEIIEQVLFYARKLADDGESLSNVVMMGMGEPFHNYEAVMKAIRILNHPTGMNLGERRFTISTVGIIPMIERFSSERSQVNLAVSLHAAQDSLRTTLLPINKKYPLDELLNACKVYTLQTGRRITFEWALINGINDTPEQARLLADRIKGLLCHVNLISLNPTNAYNHRGSDQLQAGQFQAILEEKGIPCTLRLRRGIDIQAGCGQLATRVKEDSLIEN